MPTIEQHRMFVCSICCKSYNRKSHLTRHGLTHTGQASASCPICNKSFTKSEVARRHSIQCARKNNQPLPATAKPGRKRQSCDECAHAKLACDKKSPCSRCCSLGRPCSFGRQEIALSPADSSYRAFASTSRKSSRDDNPFFFLLHLTDPSVKKDRLAIAETAGSSIRRNLETLNSTLEDALLPNSPSDIPTDEFQVFDWLVQPVITDDVLANNYVLDDCFSSKLSNQLHQLAEELVHTSDSMTSNHCSQQKALEIADLIPLFTISNLSTFISAYFHSLHWHLPIVHFPTFDPGRVSNTLLLAVFLAGAKYANTRGESDISPELLCVAEEHIFRRASSLPTTQSPGNVSVLGSTVEIIQASLIIEMLQFSQDDVQTRRRIRVVRHPCLVSIIRSLGFFNLKRRTALEVCDENTWRALVSEETCIRIACWAFLADGFLTVCFKNHPVLSAFEMACDFPWSTELFEAESVSSFNKLVPTYAAESSLPPLREVVTNLLNDSDSNNQLPWSHSLSEEHLLILIYGISSFAFQARAGLFGHISLNTIKKAASKWKSIWESITTSLYSLSKDKTLHLGYSKHAEELWWLLNATLEASSLDKDKKRLRYLETGETDELTNLNEFIQWCYKR